MIKRHGAIRKTEIIDSYETENENFTPTKKNIEKSNKHKSTNAERLATQDDKQLKNITDKETNKETNLENKDFFEKDVEIISIFDNDISDMKDTKQTELETKDFQANSNEVTHSVKENTENETSEFETSGSSEYSEKASYAKNTNRTRLNDANIKKTQNKTEMYNSQRFQAEIQLIKFLQ